MIDFKKITTVLFDFDGTLVQLNLNFSEIYRKAYSIVKKYSVDITPYKELFLIELEEAITRDLRKSNPERAEKFQREMREFFRKKEVAAAKKAKVIPGASRTLKELKRKGLKIAIITRNCKDAVEIGLGKNDFVHDILLTRDDIRPVKPQPHSLIKALKILKSEASQTIMIGDHPIDVTAGKRVGVKTIAVLSGQKTEEDFQPFTPDLIIPAVSNLLEYF